MPCLISRASFGLKCFLSGKKLLNDREIWQVDVGWKSVKLEELKIFHLMFINVQLPFIFPTYISGNYVVYFITVRIFIIKFFSGENVEK
jgi:hypothetical protein